MMKKANGAGTTSANIRQDKTATENNNNKLEEEHNIDERC